MTGVRTRFRLRAEDAPLLEKLPPDFRTVIEAAGTYEAIAHDLGIKIGTVKSRLNRARARLGALRKKNEEGNAP